VVSSPSPAALDASEAILDGPAHPHRSSAGPHGASLPRSTPSSTDHRFERGSDCYGEFPGVGAVGRSRKGLRPLLTSSTPLRNRNSLTGRLGLEGTGYRVRPRSLGVPGMVCRAGRGCLVNFLSYREGGEERGEGGLACRASEETGGKREPPALPQYPLPPFFVSSYTPVERSAADPCRVTGGLLGGR